MTSLLQIGLTNAAMASVLAVLAAGVCRLYRRPAFAHGLWLLVLVKLLTPPLVAVPLPWFVADSDSPAPTGGVEATFILSDIAVLPDANVATARELNVESEVPGAEVASGFLPSAWVGMIVGVWLLGSALCLLWFVLSAARFQRLLRLTCQAGEDIQELTAALARRIGLSRQPRVWLVPGAVSPMLWALGRPRLLFPLRLVERLDREQLKTLLLHELVHWRRRDHWVRFIELAVQVLYWWHPAVWLARNALHEAEEQCCDAWVVSVLNGAERTYALALVEAVAFLSHARLTLPATASGIGQVHQLRRRLTMIIGGKTPRSLTWAGCIGLTALAFLLLPLAPAKAQAPSGGGGIPIEIQLEQKQQPGSVDQQIEVLKSILRLLEEKKRGSGKGPEQPGPEDVQRMRMEVEHLSKVVAMKREDLANTERALKEAHARLAKVHGKAMHMIFQLQPGGAVGAVQLVPAQPDEAQKKAKQKEAEARGKLILQLSGQQIIGGDKARPSIEDMQRRLEHLMREAEALRKHLQAAQQQQK